MDWDRIPSLFTIDNGLAPAGEASALLTGVREALVLLTTGDWRGASAEAAGERLEELRRIAFLACEQAGGALGALEAQRAEIEAATIPAPPLVRGAAW